jgi:hypothetical protein
MIKDESICSGVGKVLKEWRFWFYSVGNICIGMRKPIVVAKSNISARYSLWHQQLCQTRDWPINLMLPDNKLPPNYLNLSPIYLIQ